MRYLQQRSAWPKSELDNSKTTCVDRSCATVRYNHISLPFVLRPYWQVQNGLTIQNGLLLKGVRLVIPTYMRLAMLDKLHEGHHGVVRCRSRAQSSVWWPGLSRQLEELLRSCTACAVERCNPSEPKIASDTVLKPWQKVGTDMFVYKKATYLLVVDCRRDFRKGNYKEIRKSLTFIDLNDKMKNKTATECWNILRGELDSAIDSYVPMKKQGKRSKKKHLSKEAFRKIRHKQNMWRVYKHTGKDKDYEAYKEALNAATNEVRKSKRNFEHKLAQNIKSDSKSFYAYVRSKQNVRDNVGPLEDNFGNIVTQEFLMAEELNMHFSSVFTREDTLFVTCTRNKVQGIRGGKVGAVSCNPRSSS